MIEKLKTINPYDETEIDMDTNSVAGLVYKNTPLVQKLNELVDAVNEIMTWLFETDEDSDWYDDPKHREQPADPYAEQRKWIGKLCKFWDKNREEDRIYDILHHIDPNCVYKYCRRELGGGYQYCEPVKPDDNIIYKGE